jgi:hypothetical protein
MEEDAMTRWRAENGDLFEPQQPTGAVLEPQKAAAIELLTALLTEALRSSVEQDVPANVPEAGHDEDHA